MKLRPVVQELAESMEARFREFDGVKKMNEFDTVEASLNKAYDRVPMDLDAGVEVTSAIDAANYIALALHVQKHGITDEGVNE
jgi:hypothetical protein